MTKTSSTKELPETLPKGQAMVLRIQWIAMFAACAVMTGIGVFIGPEVAATSDPAASAMMLPILSVLGLGALAVSLFGAAPLARVVAAFLPWMILRWALAESVAVFGLVLIFLGADLPIGVAFGALGALGILAQPANAAAYERFRREHQAARR